MCLISATCLLESMLLPCLGPRQRCSKLREIRKICYARRKTKINVVGQRTLPMCPTSYCARTVLSLLTAHSLLKCKYICAGGLPSWPAAHARRRCWLALQRCRSTARAPPRLPPAPGMRWRPACRRRRARLIGNFLTPVGCCSCVVQHNSTPGHAEGRLCYRIPLLQHLQKIAAPVEQAAEPGCTQSGRAGRPPGIGAGTASAGAASGHAGGRGGRCQRRCV